MGTVVVPRIAGSVAYDPTNIGITGGTIGTLTTGVVTLLAQSYVAVSAPADTTEDVLATITVPANTLGANGALRVFASILCTNNANVKTFRIHYSGIGGTIVFSQPMAGQASGGGAVIIANQNATNSQSSSTVTQINVASGVAQGIASAVDTTASTTIVITGQKATVGDTFTLVGYTVEVIH